MATKKAKDLGLHNDASYKKVYGRPLNETQKIAHALIRGEITSEECARLIDEFNASRKQ
jgi:hypothetical protein